MDLITSEEVFDSLLIEKEYNLKLPAWVDHFVYKQLEEISAKTFVFSSMTRLIQRLRTGKCAITIYGDNGMTGALSGDSLLRLITTIHIQIGLLLKEIGIALAKPDFGGKQLYVYSTVSVFFLFENKQCHKQLNLDFLNQTARHAIDSSSQCAQCL